jgi:hypothetical protein
LGERRSTLPSAADVHRFGSSKVSTPHRRGEIASFAMRRARFLLPELWEVRPGMARPVTHRVVRIARFLALQAVLTTILFVFLEGITSTTLLVYRIIRASRQTVAERLHTKYDRELGWVNTPNVLIRDMYGPAKYLQTNSQGFRNDLDFAVNVPAGKIRIICSGDSFTLGYGVGNDQAWCQLLARMDPRLETVNMGQGGYGIDQAYLWYRRDGRVLEHDIHIMAFIEHDFLRMQDDRFIGYAKPVIRVNDQRALIVENVPVPRTHFYHHFLSKNAGSINDLAIVKSANGIAESLGSSKRRPPVDFSDTRIRELALRIFQELVELSSETKSVCVFVYLPMKDDYANHDADDLRQYLLDQLQARGMIYIDLTEEFRRLPPGEVQDLFIPRGVVPFFAAEGHYSESGNEYVAKRLYQRMLAVPELRKRFSEEARTASQEPPPWHMKADLVRSFQARSRAGTR